MKSHLPQVTIVILSRDRHQNLISTINYFNNLDVKLVVLHKTNIALEIGKVPKRVFYEQSQSSFAERCRRAVDLVHTPFAMLSADDERYLPTGLEELFKTLKNNNSIASAGGQAISLSRYGNSFTAWPLYPYLNKYINQNMDLKERVRAHYSNAGNNIPFSAMYRMYRNKDFRKLFMLLGGNDNVSTPYITEVTAELFSLWLGNIAYCPKLVWVRNWLVPPVNSTDWQRSITFTEWWNDPRYQSEKLDWVKRLSVVFGSNNFKFLCDGLVSNRAQEKKENKSKFNFPVHPNIKYFLRRYFLPSTLPWDIEKALEITRMRGIQVNQDEINTVINSML